MEIAYALQGDTLDQLCWRHYGRTKGVVEQVLQANPGLAELGTTLPHGSRVKLPTAPAAAEQRQMVNLWD
ncbi:tail protein X [Pseudomonas sp. M30-35]|uniref:tail protein X n=1 Tax=Pseudomonas sp. M30-35 TaxID=1981174 RepID=UPI000B3C8F5E|nr:tail protein X [Pseudomonas sp. M30-35]ARU88296.1 phage tail protein [Pseudomonas sp. M30-35]